MNIYSLYLLSKRKKLRSLSFEHSLQNGFKLLETLISKEVEAYILSQQNKDGGFKDKAGNSDIYYTFFGYLLSHSLSIQINSEALQSYVQLESQKQQAGVNLYCLAILHKRLIGKSKTYKVLRRQILNEPQANEGKPQEYNQFMLLTAAYLLKDFSLFSTASPTTPLEATYASKPTTVLAALLITSAFGKQSGYDIAKEVLNRYDANGGFRANPVVPLADLLTTAVSLFALNFVKQNLSTIKASCMEYVGSLYENGGFVATAIDTKPDIEYTFYGLLALGALNSGL